MRNQVGVQEVKAFDFVRKKFFGERGLARAVATGNQINRWLVRGHLTFLRFLCPRVPQCNGAVEYQLWQIGVGSWKLGIFVQSEISEGILTLRISRPDKKNALNLAMSEAAVKLWLE